MKQSTENRSKSVSQEHRPSLDTEDIRNFLSHHITDLQEIYDRLHPDGGEALSASDKAALRSVLSAGWLQDIQREQRYFFEEGHVKDIMQGTKHIVSVLERLS